MTGPKSRALKSRASKPRLGTPGRVQTWSGPAQLYRTVIYLEGIQITVGNTTGVSFGGVKVFDFPKGLIWVASCMIRNITVGLTNAGNLHPIDGDDNGDIALGTTEPSDGTLSGTDVDLCPSTAIAIDTAVAGGQLAASAFFDGTTTAKDVYFNMMIDDGDVDDEDSDVLEISGEVDLVWMNCGTYDMGGGLPALGVS